VVVRFAIVALLATPGDKVIRTYGLDDSWNGEWVEEITAGIHVE
jgi:hypothetical protein